MVTTRLIAPLILSPLVLTAALLPACESSKTTASPRPSAKAPAMKATGAAAQRDALPVPTAVERSALRERALQLVDEYSRHPKDEVRLIAADAAQLAPTRLQETLRRCLRDPSIPVRTTALISVGKAGVQDFAPEAASLTRDESPFVQCAAIYAAAKLHQPGNPSPVDRSPLAYHLLNDPTTRVRAHAAFILGELGDPSALPLLRDAGKAKITRARPIELTLMQLQIAEAMVKLGDDAPLEGLRAALYPSRAEDLEASALAIQILGEVKDRGSIDNLKYLSAELVAGRYQPAEIRLEIARALAKMDVREGGFLADQFAGSPEVPLRMQAAGVYGFTAQPSDFRVLEAMLDDPSDLVKASAASALLRASTLNP